MMNANSTGKEITHATDLGQFLVRTWVDVRKRWSPLKVTIPFSRDSAFSTATWTSLFSTEVQRSALVNVAAFSSHLFLEKVNTTTGRRFFLRKWPSKWTYKFLSATMRTVLPVLPRGTALGGAEPLWPPRVERPPRWPPRWGAAPRAPSR